MRPSNTRVCWGVGLILRQGCRDRGGPCIVGRETDLASERNPARSVGGHAEGGTNPVVEGSPTASPGEAPNDEGNHPLQQGAYHATRVLCVCGGDCRPGGNRGVCPGMP